MKKVLISIGILLIGSVVALSLMASRYESKVRPGVKIGNLHLGGMTKQEAEVKLAEWWKSEGNRLLTLTLKNSSKTFKRTPEQLGQTLDHRATLEKLPLVDFWDSAASMVNSGDAAEETLPLVFKPTKSDLAGIKKYLAQNFSTPVRARVFYSNGTFTRKPEVSGSALDEAKLRPLVQKAVSTGTEIELPLKEAPKRVPDSELEKIAEVMSEFSTKFNAGQRARSTNLKVASRKINGVVLAPGEEFSFNGVVGRRTPKAGFKIAGVYLNGRHDVDLGGGICQVSTTLYNAALLSDLEIVKRSNHSMPVPYVPLGRDATVDYGTVDFVFKNSYDFPIAVNSVWEPGKLTFRILGIKDPTLKVEFSSSDRRSWAVPGKTVVDPNLAAGRSKVIEKGSSGHSINTAMTVYRNGEVVKQKSLGQSYYRGASRIIAVGAKRAAAPAASSEPEEVPMPEV